jgi:hypothetical protein
VSPSADASLGAGRGLGVRESDGHIGARVASAANNALLIAE